MMLLNYVLAAVLLIVSACSMSRVIGYKAVQEGNECLVRVGDDFTITTEANGQSTIEILNKQ